MGEWVGGGNELVLPVHSRSVHLPDARLLPVKKTIHILLFTPPPGSLKMHFMLLHATPCRLPRSSPLPLCVPPVLRPLTAQASPLACCTHPKSVSDDGNNEEDSEGILSRMPESARASMEGQRENAEAAVDAAKPEAASVEAEAVRGQEDDEEKMEGEAKGLGIGSTALPDAAPAAAAAPDAAAPAVPAAAPVAVAPAGAAVSAPGDATPASEEAETAAAGGTESKQGEETDVETAQQGTTKQATTEADAVAAAAAAAAAIVSATAVDAKKSTAAAAAAESAGVGGKTGDAKEAGEKAGGSDNLAVNVATKTSRRARFMSLLSRRGGRKKEEGEVGASMPASPLREIGCYPQSPRE